MRALIIDDKPWPLAQLLTLSRLGNVSSCIDSMPSELDDGTAENLSLLQCSEGLVDLFQGVSVGHQFF